MNYKLLDFKYWLILNGEKNFFINKDEIFSLFQQLEEKEQVDNGFFNNLVNRVGKKDITQLDKKHSDYLMLTWKNEVDKKNEEKTQLLGPKTIKEILTEEVIKYIPSLNKVKKLCIEEITDEDEITGENKYFRFIKDNDENLFLSFSSMFLKKSEIYDFNEFENLVSLSIEEEMKVKKLDLNKLKNLKKLKIKNTELEKIDVEEIEQNLKVCQFFFNERLDLRKNEIVLNENFDYLSKKNKNPLFLHVEVFARDKDDLEKELEKIADKYNSLVSNLEKKESNKRDVGTQTDKEEDKEELTFLKNGAEKQYQKIKELEEIIKAKEKDLKEWEECGLEKIKECASFGRIIQAQKKQLEIYRKQLEKLKTENEKLVNENNNSNFGENAVYCVISIIVIYLFYKLIKKLFS